MTAKLIRKISAKTVCGNVKAIAKDLKEGESKQIMEVIGLVKPGNSGIQTGETDNGPWVAFKGGFEAVDLETGESYKAPKMFLPEVATELLMPAVEAAESDVVVHFSIGIRQDENSAPGYTYIVEPKQETSESDPLEMLKKQSGFSLPAPKK